MQNYGPKAVNLVKVLDYSVIRLSLSSSDKKKKKKGQSFINSFSDILAGSVVEDGSLFGEDFLRRPTGVERGTADPHASSEHESESDDDEPE
jgi:hypothetical protein